MITCAHRLWVSDPLQLHQQGIANSLAQESKQIQIAQMIQSHSWYCCMLLHIAASWHIAVHFAHVPRPFDSFFWWWLRPSNPVLILFVNARAILDHGKSGLVHTLKYQLNIRLNKHRRGNCVVPFRNNRSKKKIVGGWLNYVQMHYIRIVFKLYPIALRDLSSLV